MAVSGKQEFNDPERYEREKVTRVMPEDLEILGLYTLRMKMPPNPDIFALESLICIIGKWPRNAGHRVDFTAFFGAGSDEVTDAESYFNHAGFMALDNTGADRLAEFDESEIEIGYIVGAVDEIDLEAAELLNKSREVVALTT